MTAAVRTLRQLQDEARAACKELCDPIERGEWRDDGSVSRHTAPSLLDQLRQAVTNSTDHRGARGRGAAIPVSADALDLLNTIKAGAAMLCEQAGVEPDLPGTENLVRALVARAGRWTDLEPVAGVTYALQGWVKAIRLLLDPPRRRHIAAACPRCGERVVWRRDEASGEDLQHPALAVDPTTGCDCLNPKCGAHWGPDQFLFLAKLLGCPPVAGVEDTPDVA